MRQLGAKLTDSEINLLVQEADVDGDGQVDINEVCMCAIRVYTMERRWVSGFVHPLCAGGPGRMFTINHVRHTPELKRYPLE